MPFTLVAFYESQTAATTLENVAAVADPHVRVEGDNIYVPIELPFLLAYYALSASLTQARLESPSLRRLSNIDIEPFDIATEPGTPPLLIDIHDVPKALEAREGLNLKVTTSAAALPVGLVFLGSGPIAPVVGEVFTVKATASATLTAYAWTNGALTFEQTLPTGRYQVVGMRAKSAGLIAARLVFSGYGWRPGCIGHDAYNDVPNDVFRAGRLGVWGEFNHDVPPTVDFLSISADTTEEIWLDLIKIA